MGIEFQVLGEPGRDNALYVQVNTGQGIYRLEFDCGEGCLTELPFVDMRAIDFVFFSHLHMDHVSGFDTFFRSTFNRTVKPNLIWGPPETARIMQHRFRGYMWNLYQYTHGTWFVNDIYPDHVESQRFEANEAFANMHAAGSQPFTGTIVTTSNFVVETIQMNHMTPSMAYVVREKPRLNIDPQKLVTLGLPPGPWLQLVKHPQTGGEPPPETIEVAGKQLTLAGLRDDLLVETPGESIAYLTDFLLNEQAMERLLPLVRDCTTIVCESQYLEADLDLALRTYHMTVTQVAELARRANAGQLILFHVSDRYQRSEWLEMLRQARAIFPNTYFPAHWRLRLE